MASQEVRSYHPVKRDRRREHNGTGNGKWRNTDRSAAAHVANDR